MGKGKSSLEQQVEKIFKHARAGSHGTRAKYKEESMRAAKWISNEFKLQNLKNLQDKHIVAYAKYMLAQDLAPKTVKTNLGAVRYMHDNAPKTKYQISDNKTLQNEYKFQIPKVQLIKGNRAWTEKELNKMMIVAKQTEQSKTDPKDARTARDFQDIVTMAKTMGMRVAEATLSSRSQAERALRTGVYHIGAEAKNGRERDVRLSPEGRQILERRIKGLARGLKLFVQQNEKSHHAIDRIEQFNKNHRKRVETQEGKQLRTWTDKYQKKAVVNNLTIHGLRYNYIQQRVQEEIDKGCNREQAAQIVTREVGHNRVDVIYIYLGGTM